MRASSKSRFASFKRAPSRRFIIFACLVAAAFATDAQARKSAKVIEKDVVVKTPDGSAEAALFYPAGKGPWPAILLWPDLGGLRPLFRELARKFAAEGFVVLTPNSFYRSTRPGNADVDPAEAAIRPTLLKYRDEASDEGIARDSAAYVAFIDRQKQTNKTKKIGAIGYDIGASYAFRTAVVLPDRVAAVGGIYGARVATERPNSVHLLVPKTKATYYVAIAKDDDVREPGDKSDIANIIKSANLQGVVDVYPADHWWGIPGAKTYDAAADARAFNALVKLCRETLR